MQTIRDRIERVLLEIRGVAASYGVDSFERARLDEWRYKRELSEKQEKILQGIEAKVFGSQEEETDGA